MNALQQFLQAASNEAAGAVSGPVDLIGMGLRKLGVPVPRNALMSSEWMKQNGLMQDVPQSGASLAGQTFGLLSPVAAAAKAPQIAGGLLKMGENAAAPVARGKMGQMGAIAWHGGDLVDNPVAYKQGVLVDGKPGLSLSTSRREAETYAKHNGGNLHRVNIDGLKFYKRGKSASLDAAYDAGDWQAIKGAGFDGVTLPNKEMVMFDYGSARPRVDQVLDFGIDGQWKPIR